MKNKTILIILTICFAFLPVISIAPAFADGENNQCSLEVCDKTEYPTSIKAACGCEVAEEENDLSGVITQILYSIIGVSGLVAVIFVIIGGIDYITSSGDSAKVEKAKKTIFYASIGIVVCALAFAIVNWVINSVLKQAL